MGLADDTDRPRARIQHGRQHIVIRGPASGPLGNAEGAEPCTGAQRGGKELAIRRIGPRPAALDIIEAQLIERRRDAVLFGGGELHPLRLLSVAQVGVVEIEPFFHVNASSLAASNPGPGRSSTPALDIRTSTPASVSATFIASTAEKSLLAIAATRRSASRAAWAERS